MQNWLITGASSGLGYGIALAALKENRKVVITARDKRRLTQLEKEWPGQAFAVELDLANKDSITRAAHESLEILGSVDVLINNAGHGYRAAIEESEPDSVAELFQTNFFGPMDLTRALLPSMRARKSGLIVTVSSIGAVRGALGNGYYSAAKGALELASEALAKEVDHLGIHLMLVEPGAMRTEFFDDRLGATSHSISDYDVLAARYRKNAIEQTHDQPGDPLNGGKTIVDTVLGRHGKLPARLLLGSDAATAAQTVLETRLEEAKTWAPVSVLADFT